MAQSDSEPGIKPTAEADIDAVIDRLKTRARWSQIIGYFLLLAFVLILGVTAILSIGTFVGERNAPILTNRINTQQARLNTHFETQTERLTGDVWVAEYQSDLPPDVTNRLQNPRRIGEAPRSALTALIEQSGDALPWIDDVDVADIRLYRAGDVLLVQEYGYESISFDAGASWSQLSPLLYVEALSLGPDGIVLASSGFSNLYQISPDTLGRIDYEPDIPTTRTNTQWSLSHFLPNGDIVAVNDKNEIHVWTAASQAWTLRHVMEGFVSDIAGLASGELYVYGGSGELFILGAQAGARPIEVHMPDTSASFRFSVAFPLENGRIAFREEFGTGALVITDHSERFSGVQTFAQYQAALDALPDWTRDDPELAAYHAEAGWMARMANAYETLLQTDGSFDTDRPFITFGNFLSNCAGETPDAAIVTACTDAFRVSNGTGEIDLYRGLALQAGAIALILFLLSSIGALYRYNLRLASFFNARAETLVLAKSGLLAGTVRPADVAQLATALAADHVDFRQVSTPVQDLTELVKDAKP